MRVDASLFLYVHHTQTQIYRQLSRPASSTSSQGLTTTAHTSPLIQAPFEAHRKSKPKSQIRAGCRMPGRSMLPSSLESDLFTTQGLRKLPKQEQREVYAASLEAYINALHNEVTKMGMRLPVDQDAIELTEEDLAGIKAEYAIGILYKANERLEFERMKLQAKHTHLHDEVHEEAIRKSRAE
ncbi:hypothetical protein NM688_g5930 [Phlebia brevispora]|uniref:Uncharacterized protein n=1 Tax=Phlebia brevispora TaxID=194682 RepID=A0ACC1SMI6_9APHY|nr:hypothetical protein NM688_g5930 [Phlebia brevispora]